MIRVGLVDDDVDHLNLLKSYLRKYSQEDGDMLMQFENQRFQVDILFPFEAE